MGNLIKLGSKMLDKLDYVLSKAWGWLCIGGLALFSYFQPAMYIYYAIVSLVAIDAFLGVWVSKKKGSFALSYLGRESGWKILFYTLLFMAIHIFERTFGSDLNIGLYITFSVAGTFELLSICANGIIIKPDFPLFRFLIKYIKGEVAKKLGIEDQDVEFVLGNTVKDLISNREKGGIRKDVTK